MFPSKDVWVTDFSFIFMEEDIFRTESLFYDGDSSEDETLQGFVADVISEKRGQKHSFEYYGISRILNKLHSDVRSHLLNLANCPVLG